MVQWGSRSTPDFTHNIRLLLPFCLVPLFVSGVSVSGTGSWQGSINDTNNDVCLVSNDTFLSPLSCPGPAAFRFVNVSVPRNATIVWAWTRFSCSSSGPIEVSLENVSNSAPFTSLSEAQNRAWFAVAGTFGWSQFDVGFALQRIVSKGGWAHGNSLGCKISLSPGSCDPLPSYASTIDISYQVQGVMDLQGPFTLVPLGTNWVSGSLNVTSFSTSIRVRIINMMIVNPFYFTTTELNVSSGFISNGQYIFECLSVQMAGSGIRKNVTCELPCAPGTGYTLTVRACLGLQSSFPIPLTPATSCFDVTADGTINFPDPVLMPATLLPDDGRPYEAGAGKSNANPTSQVLNDRRAFAANMGVQHFCSTDLNRWTTFWFGNMSLSSCSRVSVTPPSATGDYVTISCPVPPCSDSMCPERTPLYVTMLYANSITMTTRDSLMYPTAPVISAVSGCKDAPPNTIDCPSNGGVWMNITMSRSSGYAGVSVDVGGSPCTNVSVSLSNISCMLPPGIGAAQPVTVFSGGSKSSPVYISYGAPKITRLEGGVGCVPDNSFLNNTSVDAIEVCASDIMKFGASVTMCDRGGSNLVPVTITGENFGPGDIPVILKLRDTSIIAVKDGQDPHRKLYFYLPAGPGGVKLALTLRVGLQTDSALVSYQPCPLGQDANCAACDVGRYGLESSECEPCQKGRFQSKPGQSMCELCPKGTYQPALGQTSCIPCPDQMTTTGVGSDSNKACSPCPITHYFDSNSTECLRCAPNSIPHGSSCGCVSGFFDDRVMIEEEGDGTNLNCRPCPAGASCGKTGTRFTTMGPLAGWWRSGLGTFSQCLEAVNCVGVAWGAFSAQNSSSSMCVSHRSGVLCAECDQGYQPSSLQGGPCIPCESSSMAWVWASLVIVLLLIALLGVGFYFYRKSQIRTLRAEMASSSSIVSTSSFQPGTRSPSSTMQQPDARQYGSVVPELTTKLPARKTKDATSTVVSTAKIVVGFLQILSSMVTGNVALPSTFAQVVRVFSFLNFDFMPWASIRCVFHIDFYTRIYLSCLYPFLIVVLLLLCVALPVAFSNKRDFQDEETFRLIRSQFWTQTVTLALFCVFLLYPWVTLQLLQFGICLRVDDKYYLVADMTQLCLEGEWMSHLGFVIGLFLLLSIGIPVVLGTLLYRSRGRLRTKHVRQRLGFLYLAYSSECWWFEIVELATRVSLISIVRCFDLTLHAPLRMVCCLIYVAAVLLLMPFAHQSLDSLSVLCMAELMLVACLAHLLPVVGEWQGTFVDELLSALLLLLFFVFLLYSLFQLMRATRWLSHRAWFHRLLHKTPQPSDLQLGSLLSESNRNSEAEDDSQNSSVRQGRSLPG